MFKRIPATLLHSIRGPTICSTYPKQTGRFHLSTQIVRLSGQDVKQTSMDVDMKIKELMILFGKTENEIREITKRNAQLVLEQLEIVESEARGKAEACVKPQMDRLRDVTNTYEARIKICNEKSVAALRALKTNYSNKMQTAKGLRNIVQQLLKECSGHRNEYVSCIMQRTKAALNQRDHVTKTLNEALREAKNSSSNQLKESVKCHARAREDALKELKKILGQIKDCL